MYRRPSVAALALAAVSLVPALAVPAAADPGRPASPSANAAGSGTDRADRRAEDRFVKSPASRQLIVKFDRDTPESGKSALRSKYRLKTVKRIPTTGLEVVDVDPGASPSAVASSLRRERQVAHAEQNQLWTAEQASPTQDPLLGSFWGLNNTGQKISDQVGTPDVDVNAPEAWATTKGDPRVVVAVLDTGVDIGHPDLAGRIWTNPGETAGNGVDDDGNGYVDDLHGWDFVSNDSTVYDPQDGDEHGTHVAGTIAANLNNGVGGAGVAPNVQIMPLKFLGPNGGDTVGAISALAYATRMGVRITNNSWGGGGYSELLKEAIAASGGAFVAAAGNGGDDAVGDDNDASPHYPSSYDLPNVLSVAAVDNTGALGKFSNYGATSVDVGAPGVKVLSTVPRKQEVTQALQVVSTSPAYKAMVWGLGLEDVTGAASRQDAIVKTMSFLGTRASDPVLLVDDDSASGTSDSASFYAGALQAEGFTSVTTTVVSAGRSGPSAAAMAGKTVIWQTGDAYDATAGTLTATDRSNLTTFLDKGGRLFLAGADALHGSQGSPFLADRLHAVVVGEGDRRTDLTGAAAFAGSAYSTTGADSPGGLPNRYRDALAPTDAAAAQALILPAEADYSAAYASYSGTSMATPHVAGVAALAASVRRTATPAQLVEVVASSGSPLASLAGTTSTGKLVRAEAALGCGEGPDADADGSNDACDPVDDLAKQSVFAPFVETLLRSGVTKGCGSSGDIFLYCPSQQVTRAQMAVFLLRSLGVKDGTLPAYDGRFADVQDGFFAPWIAELSERKITLGCGTDPDTGKSKYCPDAPVTREQMAVFLLRAVGVDGAELPAYDGRFADVPIDSPYGSWIQELANRKVTLGCGTDASGAPKYCPAAGVTRDQMAAFLVRNFSLS